MKKQRQKTKDEKTEEKTKEKTKDEKTEKRQKMKRWGEENHIRILWEHFYFPIYKIVILLTTGSTYCQVSESFFYFLKQILDSFLWLQINWGRRESYAFSVKKIEGGNYYIKQCMLLSLSISGKDLVSYNVAVTMATMYF